MYSAWLQTKWNRYWTIRRCLNHVFPAGQLKNYQGWENLTQTRLRGPRTCKDMLKNASSDTVNWQTKMERSYKVSNPCFGWSSIQAGRTRICWRSVRSLVTNCLAMLVLGTNWTTWHPMVRQKPASIVTKWTKACDRRLARLISYIHHTNDLRQYFHVGNTAQHCRLCLFQDSELAGDFEDSTSTSVSLLCISGSRTIVTISVMRKKQSSVSHSSTGSEIIFSGCWIAYGWVTCPWSVGHGDWSTTFNKQHCKTRYGLVARQRPKETHRHQKEETLQTRWSLILQCGSRYQKRKTFSLWRFALHFWRQWSGDQNDNQRAKSSDETRVQNPQRCSWLVVRQDQFGTKDPNEVCWHQNQLAEAFAERNWPFTTRVPGIVAYELGKTICWTRAPTTIIFKLVTTKHGGVRLHGLKVGRNGTRTGGKTTSGHNNAASNSRFQRSRSTASRKLVRPDSRRRAQRCHHQPVSVTAVLLFSLQKLLNLSFALSQ